MIALTPIKASHEDVLMSKYEAFFSRTCANEVENIPIMTSSGGDIVDLITHWIGPNGQLDIRPNMVCILVHSAGYKNY